jgi:putative inorganic carbon (HCO3(-)) transporter
MQFVRQNSWILFWSICYLGIASFFLWNDLEYLALFPIGLIAILVAIFYSETAFLTISFLTPLSINIEEYTDSFGLFIPTEPLLFGLLLLFLMQHFQKASISKETWKSPIIQTVSFYLFWVFCSSILSSMPLESFKFLLARIWLIVPILFFGPVFFSKEQNRVRFIWLFCIGMAIVMGYTLYSHSHYNFAEKQGHWVMWPFFKDHTIYGSAVAMVIPLVFGLYFSKRHSNLFQMILFIMIILMLVALYFSYTRAAWLSIVAALGVLLLIRFKIKIQWIGLFLILVSGFLYANLTEVTHFLERNKSEHTTENFGERVSSVANVTTDASNLERLNRWQCALDMFLEKPMAGFGPGTYAFEYARFQRPENMTIISTNFGDGGNAHSEYLGALSEMGIVGLLTFLAVVIAIFYQSITLYIKWPKHDRANRIMIMSIIMSLTTYFVHAFLNNYLDTDKAAVPVWGMCAIIIAMQTELRGKTKSKELEN